MKKVFVLTKKMAMFLLITVLLMPHLIQSVKADNLSAGIMYDEENNGRTLLDGVSPVSDIKYMRLRNSHLNYGYIELQKISPTRAGIIATTQAHHTCPEIQMELYVDKYNRDLKKWEPWRSWEYSTTNSQHLTKNMEIIVQSGYYYSLRGYHSCVHGNVMESAETMTDGLYIGTTDKPIV